MPAPTQRPAALESELAEIDRKIALASSAPGLAAKVRSARNEIDVAGEALGRARTEVVRAKSLLASEKSAPVRAAGHRDGLRFGLDRLRAATGGAWGRVDALDNAVISLDFMIENASARIQARSAAVARAEHLESAATVAHKTALAALAQSEADLAAALKAEAPAATETLATVFE